jgi:hypothetical protein
MTDSLVSGIAPQSQHTLRFAWALCPLSCSCYASVPSYDIAAYAPTRGSRARQHRRIIPASELDASHIW